MGEYTNMVISDSLEDYIQNYDDYRRKNQYELEDYGGEMMYVNKNTGEVIINDVRIGKKIKSVKCCSCGNTLVIRQNSKSSQYFIGYSGFPKCKQTYCI